MISSAAFMEYQPSYPKWEFPAKSLPLSQKQARYDGAALYNKQEITEEVAFTILEAAY